MLRITVYTVDRTTGERTRPREVSPKGGSIFSLNDRWPPCSCPLAHSDPRHAEQVAAAEARAAR